METRINSNSILNTFRKKINDFFRIFFPRSLRKYFFRTSEVKRFQIRGDTIFKLSSRINIINYDCCSVRIL